MEPPALPPQAQQHWEQQQQQQQRPYHMTRQALRTVQWYRDQANRRLTARIKSVNDLAGLRQVMRQYEGTLPGRDVQCCGAHQHRSAAHLWHLLAA
jgi:hypothetical protein